MAAAGRAAAAPSARHRTTGRRRAASNRGDDRVAIVQRPAQPPSGRPVWFHEHGARKSASHVFRGHDLGDQELQDVVRHHEAGAPGRLRRPAAGARHVLLDRRDLEGPKGFRRLRAERTRAGDATCQRGGDDDASPQEAEIRTSLKSPDTDNQRRSLCIIKSAAAPVSTRKCCGGNHRRRRVRKRPWRPRCARGGRRPRRGMFALSVRVVSIPERTTDFPDETDASQSGEVRPCRGCH